ncbi:putative gamma-tubulin complex component GCP6 [Aspergillus steynii IBT 23096]|uniref:Spindle pole body component n=1 Tax=Aspergillus steynii IBT 23096 TaxID=1392250 RepID=A0A2I2FSI4_9EURO|nr:putative gamma-tubulin complex component GCP6 [Aspergillus steynii IBT 23096]PLB43577.1 putative gamma-tubulin complex component GCP6 [Aspergillus steynii IBT 23096]
MRHVSMIMDPEDDGVNPFSSLGLWKISNFTLQSLQPLEPLSWNHDLPDVTSSFFKSPLDLFNGKEPKLPSLNPFEFDPFDLEQQPESTVDASSDGRSIIDADQQEDDVLEDIWGPETFSHYFGNQRTLKSWESYQHRWHREPPSAYFSESGAKGFDGSLARQSAPKDPGDPQRIVRNDVLFQSLFKLGLGWSSIFFRYNRDRRKFEQVLGNIRITGVSVLALRSLTDELLACGSDMQRIRDFLAKKPSKSRDLSALSALSSATAVIMYTLEKELTKHSKNLVSLIQIKSLFQRSGELVSALANMVEAAEHAVSEAHLISIILGQAAHYSHTFGQLEDLFREVVVRIIEPFLSYVETWIGFRPETSALMELADKGKSFISLESHDEDAKGVSKTPRIDFRYRPDQMPSFIPTDQAQLIFESGQSLRLLRRFRPQHPLASTTSTAHSLKLQCVSAWNDIERIQNKAYEYEKKLRTEILRYNNGEGLEEASTQSITHISSGDKDNDVIADTFDLFDIDDEQNLKGLLANPSSIENDKIGQILKETETSDLALQQGHTSRFGPDLISSLYLSLAPLLSSQALLIDFSCLHLLFKEHKIRYHLTLQWRFQLLGDGYFTSRLSHSLFDPEMESGERKSGVVRGGVHTGLRLGSRDTWPPASSELRLVLIGLLNDCRNADDRSESSGNAEFRRDTELPGGLNFSIRDLTDEEIVKCKDPNAIEALDFLRLSYKPSDGLEEIITHQSLNKYDRLFKHLLRLLRMVSVVKGLIRDSTARDSLSGDTRNVLQRFRVDCQHFVLALGDYCFHIGVGSTWQRFQDTLSKIESCLDKGNVDGTIEAAQSVHRLRDYHEDILDQMLFALFLSKRHTEAAKLLEGIFSTILNFAPLSRLDGMRGVRHESEITVRRLYAVFRKQTSAFVGYLRNLDGIKASSKSLGRSGTSFASRDSTSVFEHLLARLDVKKYY